MKYLGFEERVLTIEPQKCLEKEEDMIYFSEHLTQLLQMGAPYILRPHRIVKQRQQYSIHYYMQQGSILLRDLMTQHRIQYMEIAEDLLWRIFYCLLHAVQYLEINRITTIRLISPQTVLLLENGMVQISVPHAINTFSFNVNESPSKQLMHLHTCLSELLEQNVLVTRRCRLGIENDDTVLNDYFDMKEDNLAKRRACKSTMRAKTPVNLIRFSSEISFSVRRATSRPAKSSLDAFTDITLCTSTLRYVLALMNSPSFNAVMTAETLLSTPNIQKLMEPIERKYSKSLNISKRFLSPLIESMVSGNAWFNENTYYILHFAGRVDRAQRTALMHLASQPVGSLYPSLREHSLIAMTSDDSDTLLACDQHIVKFLIDIESSYIDSNKASASCYALASGSLGLFSMLKEKESHIYKSSGLTPLALSISHAPEEPPNLNLLTYANVSLSSGHTCLMLASVYNASAWVPHLLNQVKVYLSDGTSALMMAADRGHTKIVKMLAPYETRHRDTNGDTALLRLLKSYLNCMKSSPDLWKELSLDTKQKALYSIVSILANGESDIADCKGKFPIDYAIDLNDGEVVQMLAMHPYPKRLPGQKTRMMNACIDHNYALACALYKSEVGIADDNGCTALMHLSMTPETTDGLRCTQLLLQSEVSLRDKDSKTALLHACLHENIEQVKLLYRYESGLLYTDKETQQEVTELQYAQKAGVSDRIIKYLSDNTPVSRDILERTPLMKYAVYTSRKVRTIKTIKCDEDNPDTQNSILNLDCSKLYSDISITELHKLVDAQAGMRDKQGRTALMYCAQYNNVNLTRLLIGKELYLRTIAGETALMHCSREPLISQRILEHLTKESGVIDKQGRTALMHAIHYSNVKLANALIGREAGIVDSFGHCALHYSVFNRKLNHVSTKLINKEADIADRSGQTSFMIACQAGNEKIAEMLFKPEYLGTKDSKGRTALMYCCHFKMERLIEITLEEAGVVISRNQPSSFKDHLSQYKTLRTMDKECLTALHLYIQAQGSKESTLSALYSKEMSVSTASGMSPLYLAISVKNIVAAEVLSRHEIDHDNIYDSKGNTPLMTAVLTRNAATIKMLAPYFCGLKNKQSGKTALFIAIENSYEDGCAILGQYESKILNKHGKYPLYVTIEMKQKNIAELLLPWGAGLISQSGHYALYAALTTGMVSISIHLLEREEKYLLLDKVSRLMVAAATHRNIEPYMDCIGQQDKNGYTALMYAIICSNRDAAQLLFEKESDLADKTGQTPLMYAAQYNMNNLITIPHASRSFKKQMKRGWTALMWAVASGNTEAVELLKNEESGLTTIDGETALMLAAKSGQVDAVKALAPLEGGLYISALSSLQRGFTALYFAAVAGHEECVKILLENTQEAHIKTFAKKTASEWARACNFFSCAELIEEAISPTKAKVREKAKTETQKDQKGSEEI